MFAVCGPVHDIVLPSSLGQQKSFFTNVPTGGLAGVMSGVIPVAAGADACVTTGRSRGTGTPAAWLATAGADACVATGAAVVA